MKAPDVEKFKAPLINESLADTIIVYIIIKRLATPFEEWDAYKRGIIDKDGKKLREPVTFEERRAWTALDRFIWNMKKVLTRFVGPSKMAAILTGAYLLKDSIKPIFNALCEKYKEDIDGLTAAKQLEVLQMIRKVEAANPLKESHGNELDMILAVKSVKKQVDPEEVRRVFGI